CVAPAVFFRASPRRHHRPRSPSRRRSATVSLNRAPIGFAAVLRRLVVALALVLAATHVKTTAVAAEPPGRFDTRPPPMDRSTEDRVLALDPANISAADVRDVLAYTPAPRIIALQGSVAPITMEPFAEY